MNCLRFGSVDNLNISAKFSTASFLDENCSFRTLSLFLASLTKWLTFRNSTTFVLLRPISKKDTPRESTWKFTAETNTWLLSTNSLRLSCLSLATLSRLFSSALDKLFIAGGEGDESDSSFTPDVENGTRGVFFIIATLLSVGTRGVFFIIATLRSVWDLLRNLPFASVSIAGVIRIRWGIGGGRGNTDNTRGSYITVSKVKTFFDKSNIYSHTTAFPL